MNHALKKAHRGARGKTMGSLSTHVLDTASGRPATGIRYTLYRAGTDRQFVCTGETNDDGRPDPPLLSSEQFEPGTYELVFSVADYFARNGMNTRATPFLDEIVLRFSLSESESYHVPLLVSPWGYSMYRGS